MAVTGEVTAILFGTTLRQVTVTWVTVTCFWGRLFAVRVKMT